MCVEDIRIGRKATSESVSVVLNNTGGNLFKRDQRRLAIHASIRTPLGGVVAAGIPDYYMAIYSDGVCIGTITVTQPTLNLHVDRLGELVMGNLTYTTQQDQSGTQPTVDVSSIFLTTTLPEISADKGD